MSRRYYLYATYKAQEPGEHREDYPSLDALKAKVRSLMGDVRSEQISDARIVVTFPDGHQWTWTHKHGRYSWSERPPRRERGPTYDDLYGPATTGYCPGRGMIW